jgi:hypothetical protein
VNFGQTNCCVRVNPFEPPSAPADKEIKKALDRANARGKQSVRDYCPHRCRVLGSGCTV